MSTEFTPPGPGQWQLDRSHFPGGATPIMQTLISVAGESAYRKQWPILGIPAETMSFRFVNGFTYTRLRPLVLADRPSAKPPPTIKPPKMMIGLESNLSTIHPVIGPARPASPRDRANISEVAALLSSRSRCMCRKNTGKP